MLAVKKNILKEYHEILQGYNRVIEVVKII
jgi:hypothetical protein